MQMPNMMMGGAADQTMGGGMMPQFMPFAG